MEDKIQAFLEDLQALTAKYDLRIGGCGCCGSPYLTQEGFGDKEGQDLKWLDAGTYEVQTFCVDCQGMGTINADGDPCPVCGGTGNWDTVAGSTND